MNLDDIAKLVANRHKFEFKGKAVWQWVAVNCALIIAISFFDFLPIFIVIILILATLGLLYYNISAYKCLLIIDVRGIQVIGRFSKLNINYNQIHNIEYYIQTQNGIETDYYAKIILKTGRTHDVSLKYWRFNGPIKAKIFIKEVIETNLRYFLLSQNKPPLDF